MRTADGSNLGIELGDGFALSFAIASNDGEVLGGFLAKGKNFVEKILLKHSLSEVLEALLPCSIWQNGDAVQNFSLGNGGDVEAIPGLRCTPCFYCY